MSFGENLISLRKQMGWSQDDLANNLNLSRQAISKWENDTSKPDIDNVKKISKIFSVTIDDLLNNEVPKEKAVALDVKKEEKKERTITIVKLMIIAVIVLYVISVIYKFASLLIIVNGVQKYANLSNYHYVITTYDENGLAEKEECWFKDGVSKTVNVKFENNEIIEDVCTFIDFNKNEGYIEDNVLSIKTDLDLNLYKTTHIGFETGNQLYSKFPIEIRSENIKSSILEMFIINGINLNNDGKYINIKVMNSNIILDDKTLMPVACFSIKERDSKVTNVCYDVELGSVNKI